MTLPRAPNNEDLFLINNSLSVDVSIFIIPPGQVLDLACDVFASSALFVRISRAYLFGILDGAS